MYITIDNIKGEKRIDLPYSTENFDSHKEIAVIRMLGDNVQYQDTEKANSNGRPSNKLLTYHVIDDKDFTNPKPHNIANLKTESLHN